MSFSYGQSKSKSSTASSSQTDPWDVTIPYLQDFLGKLDTAKPNPGPTAGQRDAYGNLLETAKGGNPYAADMDALSKQLFGAPDRTAGVAEATDALGRRIGDVADGKTLDVMNDPRLQAMLTQVADTAKNTVNAQFAAAGRDLSGANQGAVAKGITEAQTPLLLQQYNTERQAQLDAAKTLYGAETGEATTSGQLDQIRAQLGAQGVTTAEKALEALTWGDNQTINLEQQLKTLGIQDMAQLAAILFPAAGLGAQESGTSQTSGKSSGFGIGASLR